MKTIDIKISKNSFEYGSKTYDIEYAVKEDTDAIIREAESNHKDEFSRLYVKESLTPEFIRLYINEKNEPVYGMLIYSILYQDWYKEKAFGIGRKACGNYYPILEINKKYYLEPHSYGGCICW